MPARRLFFFTRFKTSFLTHLLFFQLLIFLHFYPLKTYLFSTTFYAPRINLMTFRAWKMKL